MKKRLFLGLLILAVACLATACSRRQIPVLTARDLDPSGGLEEILPDYYSADWTYFQAAEAQYNSIVFGQTSTADMVSLIGEPNSIEETEEEGMMFYHYADASYYVDANHVYYVTVYTKTEAYTPRDIQVGDRFEEVVRKFPQEQDYTQAAEDGFHYLYGQDIYSYEPVGYVNLNAAGEYQELIVTSEALAFMKINFSSGRVESISIYAYPL